MFFLLCALHKTILCAVKCTKNKKMKLMHLQFKHLNFSAFSLFSYDYLTHVFLLGSPQTFLGLLSGRCWIGPLTRILSEIRVCTPDSGLTSPFLFIALVHSCLTLSKIIGIWIFWKLLKGCWGNLVGKSFSEYLSWHVKVWFVQWNSNTIPSKGLGWPLKSNCF